MFLPKLKQGKLFEYVEKSNRSYYRTYKKTKLNIIAEKPTINEILDP